MKAFTNFLFILILGTISTSNAQVRDRTALEKGMSLGRPLDKTVK